MANAMKTQNSRTLWIAVCHFHEEALERLGQMERGAFWDWMAARMVEISNAHGNGELITALLLAVFEDVEAADKKRRDDTITVKGA